MQLGIRGAVEDTWDELCAVFSVPKAIARVAESLIVTGSLSLLGRAFGQRWYASPDFWMFGTTAIFVLLSIGASRRYRYSDRDIVLPEPDPDIKAVFDKAVVFAPATDGPWSCIAIPGYVKNAGQMPSIVEWAIGIDFPDGSRRKVSIVPRLPEELAEKPIRVRLPTGDTLVIRTEGLLGRFSEEPVGVGCRHEGILFGLFPGVIDQKYLAQTTNIVVRYRDVMELERIVQIAGWFSYPIAVSDEGPSPDSRDVSEHPEGSV